MDANRDRTDAGSAKSSVALGAPVIRETAGQRLVRRFLTDTVTPALTALAEQVNREARHGAVAVVETNAGLGRVQVTLRVCRDAALDGIEDDRFVCAIYGYVTRGEPSIDILMRPAIVRSEYRDLVSGGLRLPGHEQLHWSQLTVEQLQGYVASRLFPALAADAAAERGAIGASCAAD